MTIARACRFFAGVYLLLVLTLGSRANADDAPSTATRSAVPPLDRSGKPTSTWVTYRCKFRVDD